MDRVGNVQIIHSVLSRCDSDPRRVNYSDVLLSVLFVGCSNLDQVNKNQFLLWSNRWPTLLPSSSCFPLHMFIFVSLGVLSFGGVWSILLGSGPQFYLFLSRCRSCCPRPRVPTHRKQEGANPTNNPTQPTRMRDRSHCRVHLR